MNCAACQEKSNYVFCEGCLSWLMEGETEFVDMGEGEGLSEE